ncbi:MAG TPA: PEGA domain-containing protein [Xanthobacteraceae bacterium]|nr:PEGA domain-containing protein [Xanthobacteraceae bacterium]
MSRVIAFVACGFTLAACSASMPSLDFFKSSPATETLRIESEPPGADAKTTQGQACRTPCELTVQGGADLSVTLALNGYQPQTVALRSDQAEGKLSPNPLYVELQAAAAPAPAKKKALKKRKPNTAAATQSAPAAAPATAAFPPPPASTEPTSSANYPWPTTR